MKNTHNVCWAIALMTVCVVFLVYLFNGPFFGPISAFILSIWSSVSFLTLTLLPVAISSTVVMRKLEKKLNITNPSTKNKHKPLRWRILAVLMYILALICFVHTVQLFVQDSKSVTDGAIYSFLAGIIYIPGGILFLAIAIRSTVLANRSSANSKALKGTRKHIKNPKNNRR